MYKAISVFLPRCEKDIIATYKQIIARNTTSPAPECAGKTKRLPRLVYIALIYRAGYLKSPKKKKKRNERKYALLFSRHSETIRRRRRRDLFCRSQERTKLAARRIPARVKVAISSFCSCASLSLLESQDGKKCSRIAMCVCMY